MKRTNERLERYVGLPHSMMDSAAYKTLRPNAVWLFALLLRQFRPSMGGYGHLVLPFADVKYKLSFGAFQKAKDELTKCGFIWLVQQGGLRGKLPGYGAAIYAAGQGTALGERWKERSIALFKDPEAGKIRKLRRLGDDDRPCLVWEPFKPITRKASQENWKQAAKAIKRKKQISERRRGASELLPSPPEKNREKTDFEHEHTPDSR